MGWSFPHRTMALPPEFQFQEEACTLLTNFDLPVQLQSWRWLFQPILFTRYAVLMHDETLFRLSIPSGLFSLSDKICQQLLPYSCDLTHIDFFHILATFLDRLPMREKAAQHQCVPHALTHADYKDEINDLSMYALIGTSCLTFPTRRYNPELPSPYLREKTCPP